MENSDTRCGTCQRGHLDIDCPYREIRGKLQKSYSEGYHYHAEMAAKMLGLELNVSHRPLLERLSEPEIGREQTPADLPPVGTWDPEFLEGRRALSDIINERVTDHTSNPRTLLNDSDYNTIRHGSVFEYWTRRRNAFNTSEVVEEQSDAHVQEPYRVLFLVAIVLLAAIWYYRRL